MLWADIGLKALISKDAVEIIFYLYIYKLCEYAKGNFVA